jgi:hypothetical protein
MTEKELKDTRAKNEELVAKACVYTNAAYALVEVADSIMLDVNGMLKSVGAELNRGEKAKYKNALKVGKNFKVWLKDLAKIVYEIDNAEHALEDSDMLYDIMLLIIDRCGGEMDTLTKIRAMLFNNFKSKYGYYK